jgi:hypothetical protein
MTAHDKERLLANFNGNPPADASAVRQFEAEFHLRLAEDYVQFLEWVNGGEGFIGKNVYIILWRVEELLEMNTAYHVAEYAPGLFLFGSDGGGEAFAFDTRSDANQIVSVPFVGMELSLARALAPNFGQFLEKLYQS